ncbi:hypothetical protein FHL15_004924 [Xylaria flabelliformis]|uniref:Uncharacterized protein n=1 Tax=Xylaria flabelliformis TaxID=2512241 RepID=A0A553I1S5_9PEZI|nr:hypothetical protein FHL15_004924 [Xylaria flabelliformis]
MLAHRCFSDAFASCPGIAETIIRQQIHPQLQPLAIAHIEASHKTYTRRDRDEVKRLYLDVFENPTRFTDRIDTSNLTNPLPTRDLIQMGRVYDVIADNIGAGLVDCAVGLIIDSRPGKIFSQSESEWLRFFRAFYRLELFFKLWWTYAVMEAESVQPHEIGLSNDDPLVRDSMRHRWIDIWISQGLEFWLLVRQADSHETRLALLASAIKRKYVFFEEMYLETFPASRLFEPWITFQQNAVEVDIPNTDYDDSDSGPSCMWITCHQPYTPRVLMVDFESTLSVAKRAYLF